jgi:hypothetical protein
MNISTTPRRVAQGLLVLCFTLASMVGAKAQCADFIAFPPGTVNINLALGVGPGATVDLTDAVLNANGFTIDPLCSYDASSTGVGGPFISLPLTFNCGDVLTNPHTLHVRTGGPGGPGATIKAITINVVDNIAPTITCVGNQVRPAGPSCTYTAGAFEFDWVTVADNCATNITYSLSGATTGSGMNTLNGVVFGQGLTTVTWTVMDNALPVPNQASCSFTVTVNDVTPPTISCPANVVAPNAPANGTCQWVGVGLGVTAGMVADNCVLDAALLATLTNNITGPGALNGYNFGLGVTNVTYTINDGANPPVNCMFTVDVTDQTNPTITCPANKVEDALGSPMCNFTVPNNSYNASAADNCSILAGTPVIVSTPGYNGLTTLNGAVFNVGTTNVTWSVTDGSGNMSNCVFSVTVNDVTPPTVVALPPGIVTFQSVFNVNTAPGSCSQSVSWYRPSFLTHNSTDCFLPVTLTENDTVSINCPGLSCVNDPNFFTSNGVTPYPYDETNLLHNVTPVSANFPVGTTVITYEFEDAYGNITPITVTVNVMEAETPDANCVTGPVSITLDPLFGVAIVTPNLINDGSTDNCGIDSLGVSPSTFTCDSLGTRKVTLTVFDNAGNTSTCSSTVFVSDNTLPVIGCPSSFVVAANANCNATVPGLIFNVGSSSPAVLEYFDNALDPCGLTFEYKVNAGMFNNLGLFVSNPVNLSAVPFLAGNNSVTLRATDGSGNITVCNFTVSVQDQTGPTVTCPMPMVNPLLIGSCSATATWPNPSATDNCTDAMDITFSSTFPSGFNFPGGTTVVTYTALDEAGNIGTCSFNVVVLDNQNPVAKCKNISVNLSSTIGAGSVTVTPSMVDNLSTDNCGYSYVNLNVNYTCANLGNNNYTLEIKDAAGNTSTCVAVVTVNDVTAPSFTCPANMTLNANAVCQASLTGTATATDNCSIVSYEYDLNPPAPVAFTLLNNGATGNLANIPALPLGATTVTLRASDNASPANSSTCSFLVTVVDVTPPVLVGVPANTTVACNAIPPVVLPTATDNCGAASVVYLGELNSATPCVYTLTRTWKATDGSGNMSTMSQVITVQDIVGPVFNAAYHPTGIVNINVTSALVCTGNYTLTVVNITNITDACNGVSGIAYNLVPATGAPSSGVLTLAAGVYTLPVSTFPIGTNVVTLTASDGCGNTTTKVVNIVVADNQAPVFQNNYAAAPAGICGKVFTLPNTTNNCDQLFTWTRPIASDVFDCGNETVTEVISNATVQAFVNLLNPFPSTLPIVPPGLPSNVIAQFPVGQTTVTYTATQGANVSTCSFIVKILDTQAPTITCPSNQNLSISSACSAAATVPTYPPASVLDNCPNNVAITQTPAPGTLVSTLVPVIAGNTFTVTLIAKDTFPNNLMSVPCSFTVTLVDSQSPVPLITTLANVVSNCTKYTVVAPGATDCNGVSIDTLWGTPSVNVMMVLPPAYAGGPPSYVLNPGNYVITWSYTDPQNNTTTQPQSVFITVDVTPPVAIAQPLSVNLDAMGNAFITALQLNNGSFDQDNCGPLDLSIRTGTSPNFVYVDTLDLDCSNLANMGVNTVIFAATDINGNVSTFQTTVTVHDVTSPVFTGAWTATQMDTAVQACAPIPPPASFPQIATDQCDLVVNIALLETSTQDTIGCGKYSYVINRTWTATDDSGNTATRTQKIIVADTQAPIYAANTPLTVIANTAPNAIVCNAAVNFNMAAFVSDCEAAADLTITNTLISGPVSSSFIPAGSNISAPNYPIGTYVVRFTTTDKCGNSATKDVTIQVNDATPPTAVCINGVSASLQPSGIVVVTVNQFNNNSYDNCTSSLDLLIQRLDQNPLVAPTPSLEYNCDDADGVTQHGVKLFVADSTGNMSMCLTYIVIQDNVAPSITCPANDTLDCAANTAPQLLGFATAVDNCPNNVSIDFTDVLASGTGPVCELLTRTWSAMDLANNISTCEQLISLVDTIKPVLSAYPPDETISCSTPLPAPATITATDNCSSLVTVLFDQDTINIAQGPCGQFNYTIVRTRTAVDDCGNTEIHSRLINVEDITEPIFAGMPDTLVLNTSQFPPNLTCTVPLVLNVAQFLEDCTPDTALLVTNDAPFGDGSFNISGNYPIGNYWVFFSAIDVCGNLGIDSLYIQVVDNSVPTLVCNNNIVIALGTNGEATINPGDIDLGSTDNCDIDTMYLSQNMFDCGDLGLQTVTLTAEDIYGNTNACIVEVEVTLGVNSGFNLTATGTPESYFGAENGTATAVATGGTGLFSFVWSSSPSDTTAVLDSLAAGTYTVSVTDVNSGCIAVDTVVIVAGAKITLTVGAGNACQGQTLSIPVTVDNFISVTGFNFGLALGNGVAGTITGISNVNPALVGLITGVNTVFWAEPTQTPTNLLNGTVLFNVEIQLSNAVVGTTSTIIASALPALIFLHDGTVQAPMVVFNAGSATISCPASATLKVEGDVFTWKAPVKPIPNVTLTLGGTAPGVDVTALPNANYSFMVASGSNTVVTGNKVSTVKNQQINVGDMLGIQAHAALQVAFSNGYQWVAGDINGDQRINLLDYALVQKYVLGNNPHFRDNQGNQVGPDWKFVPETHMFMPLPLGNPQPPMLNPLNNPVPPNSIAHNNILVDFLDDDFVGVLIGDVNGSVMPDSLTSGGGGADNAALKFRLNDRSVQAGETVTIPFNALDFTNTRAYQMTIGFDPEVFELQDIQSGVLPGLTEGNFGTDYLVDGLLSTLWVGDKPTSFNDNETLFSLTFKALEDVSSLSSVLHSSSAIAEALAIDQAGHSVSVDLEFVTSVATGEVESKIFALYQNQPNPFTSETSISFRLPESGRATLRVFSAEGRLVKTVIGDFAEGINAIKFQKSDIGSNGVFYYELETPKHSDRKKMILID